MQVIAGLISRFEISNEIGGITITFNPVGHILWYMFIHMNHYMVLMNIC